MLYRAPTVAQMKALKEQLGPAYSGVRLARLSGLKSSRRWREHVDENKPLGMPPANLFMLAAMLTQPPAVIESILTAMRAIGATIDLDAPSDSPEQTGD